MDEKGLSVADALALSKNDDTFGGGNGAWWLIILILFFGIGGRGFAAGNTTGSTNSGVTDGYILTSDFANIERKIDGVDNGLCDGFYAMNTGLLNGFSGVNSNVTNSTAAITSAITTDGYETRNAIQSNAINAMQNANALQSQLAQCCCNNREAISGVNYNMATQSNAIQTLINSTNNSLERQLESGLCNTNYNMTTQNNTTLQAIDKVGDRIIDYLSNEKIQTLRDENQALRLAASQSAQNNYLIDQLRTPSPIPAYVVSSPYYSSNSCGCM